MTHYTSFERQPNGLYYFFGHPAQLLNKTSPRTIRSNPIGVLCCKYTGAVHESEGYDPNVHVFLQFENKGISIRDGSELEAPRLHGISGCGIWRLCTFTNNEVSKLDGGKLRLVAVQHSALHGRYVRGTRIESIQSLIVQAFPDLKRAMELGYPPA